MGDDGRVDDTAAGFFVSYLREGELALRRRGRQCATHDAQILKMQAMDDKPTK